ncbi:AAA domain-containing protein [Streptomyces sp. BI20]|uniref:AAA domain-containing protein n=1 Tax=Streptomyces sp. BI20 TaxID=3403460 RepID=UPI003C794C20
MGGDGARERRRQTDLIDSWRAVELFAPPVIPARPRRPRPGDGQVVDLVPAPGGRLPGLPWAAGHPVTGAGRAPRGRMWRHEVYGGVFDLERLRLAMVASLPTGTDPDSGAPALDLELTGQSAMFALVLDEHGRPVEGTSVISAAGWAAGRLFDPGPGAPGWLDGFEDLDEAFGTAVDDLTAAPLWYERPAPATPAGAPEPAGAGSGEGAGGGWQGLLAEILGGAAVAAVGMLFGGVAGALVQGAAEPLVRRAADWAAARRRPAGPAPSPSPGAGAGAPAPAAAPAAEEVPVEGSGARPVAFADLVALSAQIAELCGVTELLAPRTVRVRSTLVRRPVKRPGPTPEAPFLNSLLPSDLGRVRDAVAADGAGAALGAYLTPGADVRRADRVDLRAEPGVVLAGVAPGLVPAGRWPTAPRFPLVLGQQFAVDRMLADLSGPAGGGLFSVNGPPGTGKTTMLRDLIAALVVERAGVLAGFDDPRRGFTGTPWKGRDPQGYPRTVRGLDPRLAGFEMVVASSNNGAVRNITAELPARGALAEPWRSETDHFADLAGALLGGEPAWGLIAAVLGNRGNRREFVQRFWWGRLPAEEAEAREEAGAPPLVGMESWLRARREPADGPPEREPGTPEVLPWAEAVAAFRAALAEVERRREPRLRWERLLAEAESGREAALAPTAQALARAEERVREAERAHRRTAAEVTDRVAQVRVAEEAHARAGATVPRARLSVEEARADLSGARRVAEDHRRLIGRLTALLEEPEPAGRGLRGGLRRLLRSPAEREAESRAAAAERAGLLDRIDAGHAALETALARVRAAAALESAALEAAARDGAAVDAARVRVVAARAAETAARRERERSATTVGLAHEARAREAAEHERARAALRARRAELIAAAGALPSLPLGWEDLSEAERESGSPWTDEDWGAARSELFLRALDLHRSFVAANAAVVWGNLRVLVEALEGRDRAYPAEQVLRAWQTLFLLVPVVSTTFSSVGAMFARLGRESLGWVLVDEAGQAAPQAAVGALWRARRAVLVGDPLQLEPVVTMPVGLQRRLLAAHGVGAEWLPSAGSAQSLADRVNRYGTLLPAPAEEDGRVWVGAPLRVHRRCEEPMFTIANEVAYGGMMVHGTASAPFPDEERDGLLPSRWLDTGDPGRDPDAPWGERDRKAFVFVLDHLRRAGVAPERIRIIAPFRALVKECVAVCAERPEWTWELREEHCATVHRAQGKESDVVVLVLGGNRPGARRWAAGDPRLVNVAASRAKRRLYVIGERALWAPLAHFDVLAGRLEVFEHVRDRETWGPVGH